MSGSLKPLQELKAQQSPIPSRFKVFKVSPRVLIDNKASAGHTLIEVNARDRVGLVHEITLALTRLNLIIHSALVTTYGLHAVDTFYVQDAFGKKIESKPRLARIKKRLMEVLTAPKCLAAPPPERARIAPAAASPASAAE